MKYNNTRQREYRGLVGLEISLIFHYTIELKLAQLAEYAYISQ